MACVASTCHAAGLAVRYAKAMAMHCWPQAKAQLSAGRWLAVPWPPTAAVCWGWLFCSLSHAGVVLVVVVPCGGGQEVVSWWPGPEPLWARLAVSSWFAVMLIKSLVCASECQLPQVAKKPGRPATAGHLLCSLACQKLPGVPQLLAVTFSRKPVKLIRACSQHDSCDGPSLDC